MKTIKLELSVKLLLGAIALGLFLNAFKDFPPKAYANKVQEVEVVNTIYAKVRVCDDDIWSECADVRYGNLEVDTD